MSDPKPHPKVTQNFVSTTLVVFLRAKTGDIAIKLYLQPK